METDCKNAASRNCGRSPGRGRGKSGHSQRGGRGCQATERPRRGDSYYHTHGNCTYTSGKYETPVTNHQSAATFTNMMGGSTANCNWWCGTTDNKNKIEQIIYYLSLCLLNIVFHKHHGIQKINASSKAPAPQTTQLKEDVTPKTEPTPSSPPAHNSVTPSRESEATNFKTPEEALLEYFLNLTIEEGEEDASQVASPLFDGEYSSIVDTAATHHCLEEEASKNCTNIFPTSGPAVTVTKGNTISPKAQVSVPLSPVLSTCAQHGYVFDDLRIFFLISLGKICDDDCIAIFSWHNLKILKNNQVIIVGRRINNGLWEIPMSSTKSRPLSTRMTDVTFKGKGYGDERSPVANGVLKLDKTKKWLNIILKRYSALPLLCCYVPSEKIIFYLGQAYQLR